jgi:hypothetical protein
VRVGLHSMGPRATTESHTMLRTLASHEIWVKLLMGASPLAAIVGCAGAAPMPAEALACTPAPTAVGEPCALVGDCKGPHEFCVATDATSTTGHCQFLRLLP